MNKFKIAEIWEDGLRTNPKKKSFEWWYFDANFEDKSTLVITFFTKPPAHPNGPPKPSISAVYTSPDGQKSSFTKNYSASDFSAKKEKCDVKMGKNKVTGNLKDYKIILDLPGISGEIDFHRVAPSYSTRTDDKKPEYFGWFPAIPFGTVKGKITVNNSELKLKGTGYHDHNWGIINIQDACDYWYWGRANAGDYYMIFTVMYLPKILGGKTPSILYLAKGDKILIGDSENLEVKKTNINPPTPKVGHLPTELTFEYNNGENKVDFTLSKPQLIESLNPLNHQPLWQKILTKLFFHPLYVRYNANLELNLQINGKKDSKKGNGLYEIMILH